MKKKKVWVLTSGTYSDYRICAIFSDKATADAAMELDRDRDSSVEEWVLDAAADPVKRGESVWLVWMTRDGNAQSPSQFGYNWRPEPFHIDTEKGCCKFLGYARDAEHAIKICNEKRTRAIADGKF
jgi:hypothetical protein